MKFDIYDDGISGLWYEDVDEDGYGDINSISTNCSLPVGYVSNDSDCDDGDPLTNPGANDVCDGGDNDCNGVIDDDLAFFGKGDLCAADSCFDVISEYPQAEDGIFWVDPDGTGAYEIYCDQSTDGGGWNLISVVRNDDSTQVIVDNNYCTSIDTDDNCKGKMPISAAFEAEEILIYDLDSTDYLVYEGFTSSGAFGYFTLSKQLIASSSCSAVNHVCGSVIDPNLSIATTSGYTYNYSAPLYQWWRIGGWWVGAAPNSGNAAGRVHGSSYGSSHDLRNRSSSGGSTLQQSAGHQALYYR